MRRVLLMISSLRGGGSERQVLLLLRHLDRTRIEPHLYLLERTGDLLAEVPGDVPIHAWDDSPRPQGLYVPGRLFRAQAQHLGQLLRRHAIDVVYDRTFHMTMIAAAAQQPQIPRISTMVSPPDQAFPLVESRFRWFKHRRLTRAYHTSEHVVAVSDAVAESAASFYQLARSRICTIANAVDRPAVEQAATQPAPRRDDRVTFVCVGRMTREKGQRDLIDALSQLEGASEVPALRVWLVGEGPLRGDLESQARACLQRHQVDFLSTLSNPAPAIAAADALILPSLFEGMPNVVLEAFTLFTPVIATRAGGTTQLERDQPTMLWAEPGNPSSIAAAMRHFLTDRPGAARRAEAGRRLVEQHHDVATMTRTIEALLQPAFTRPTASRPAE